MTSDGQPIGRLREYLRGLKPQARAMLVTELERGLLRGEENAGNDVVLQELRAAIRAAAQPVPRIADAARLFFAPLEPFLIDGRADHKRVGRIARISLEPIWQWIGRDLMPAEVKALSDSINRALAADERAKAEQMVRALHARAVQRMSEAIGGIGADEKARRRLVVQVGTPRALDDLATLRAVLSLRDVLAELGRRLPARIRVFEDEQIGQAKAALDAAVARMPPHVQKTDVFLYGLLLVMQRLAAPWELVRIATHAAGSDDTARIAQTPYAVAVTIVLGELDDLVDELRAELKSGRPVVSLLKGLHDAARELRSDIDLADDSAWSRQLAAIRGAVSDLLKYEIDVTPGNVRRLLRPRPAKDIEPGSRLDPIDVNDVAARLEFLAACRLYAGELAMNEATLRAHSELTHYLETGTKVLLDTLRAAGPGDRPFRQSQVEAAIRFCGSVFGPDYAALLAKAAEVAAQAPSADRAAAKA